MEETMPVVTNMGHEFEWANLMLAPPWSTTGRDSSNFTDAQLNGTSNFYASYESGCGVTTQKCTFFCWDPHDCIKGMCTCNNGMCADAQGECYEPSPSAALALSLAATNNRRLSQSHSPSPSQSSSDSSQNQGGRDRKRRGGLEAIRTLLRIGSRRFHRWWYVQQTLQRKENSNGEEEGTEVDHRRQLLDPSQQHVFQQWLADQKAKQALELLAATGGAGANSTNSTNSSDSIANVTEPATPASCSAELLSMMTNAAAAGSQVAAATNLDDLQESIDIDATLNAHFQGNLFFGLLAISVVSVVHAFLHHGIKEPYKRLVYQHSMHHWLRYGRDGDGDGEGGADDGDDSHDGDGDGASMGSTFRGPSRYQYLEFTFRGSPLPLAAAHSEDRARRQQTGQEKRMSEGEGEGEGEGESIKEEEIGIGLGLVIRAASTTVRSASASTSTGSGASACAGASASAKLGRKRVTVAKVVRVRPTGQAATRVRMRARVLGQDPLPPQQQEEGEGGGGGEGKRNGDGEAGDMGKGRATAGLLVLTDNPLAHASGSHSLKDERDGSGNANAVTDNHHRDRDQGQDAHEPRVLIDDGCMERGTARIRSQADAESELVAAAEAEELMRMVVSSRQQQQQIAIDIMRYEEVMERRQRRQWSEQQEHQEERDGGLQLQWQLQAQLQLLPGDLIVEINGEPIDGGTVATDADSPVNNDNNKIDRAREQLAMLLVPVTISTRGADTPITAQMMRARTIRLRVLRPLLPLAPTKDDHDDDGYGDSHGQNSHNSADMAQRAEQAPTHGSYRDLRHRSVHAAHRILLFGRPLWYRFREAGTCQSSSALMMKRRGVELAGTGAIYFLFPVLFFAFVVYQCCWVLPHKARWVDPKAKAKAKARARAKTKALENENKNKKGKFGGKEVLLWMSTKSKDEAPQPWANEKDLKMRRERREYREHGYEREEVQERAMRDSPLRLDQLMLSLGNCAQGGGQGGEGEGQPTLEPKDEKKEKDEENVDVDDQDNLDDQGEEEEAHWENIDADDDYVNRYGILFEDYRGNSYAELFKALDVFRMLVAGTAISVLAEEYYTGTDAV
eukprot:g1693.t1